MRQYLKTHRHIWLFSYLLVYLPAFFYLENRVVSSYYVIHSALDDKIPFLEIFIVPYVLWFIYVIGMMIYYYGHDTKEFYRLGILLGTGMTLFLVVSFVFPSRLYLRPQTFERDNLFTWLVGVLYRIDTPTNVLPSIHVFNTLAVCLSIWHHPEVRKRRWFITGMLVLGGLIVLSTMFLKQHSVIDVVISFGMLGILYPLVYKREYRRQTTLFHRSIKNEYK